MSGKRCGAPQQALGQGSVAQPGHGPARSSTYPQWRAKGQKSYWAMFHGDVTLTLRLHASVGQKAAHRVGLQQLFRGVNQ
jgi:hypothetical protein